jgi:hypothetical protein
VLTRSFPLVPDVVLVVFNQGTEVSHKMLLVLTNVCGRTHVLTSGIQNGNKRAIHGQLGLAAGHSALDFLGHIEQWTRKC